MRRRVFVVVAVLALAAAGASAAGGSSSSAWSAAATIRTCGSASDPRVVFPYSLPSVRSGHGAILWLGAAPNCSRGGATALDSATLHSNDQVSLPRSLSSGVAPSGPLAVAGTTAGQIVAVAGERSGAVLGEAPAGYPLADRQQLGGGADEVATADGWIGDADVVSTASLDGSEAIELRAQRHYARSFAAPVIMREGTRTDQLADGRDGLPRRLDRALGGGREAARAVGLQRRPSQRTAGARARRLRHPDRSGAERQQPRLRDLDRPARPGRQRHDHDLPRPLRAERRLREPPARAHDLHPALGAAPRPGRRRAGPRDAIRGRARRLDARAGLELRRVGRRADEPHGAPRGDDRPAGSRPAPRRARDRPPRRRRRGARARAAHELGLRLCRAGDPRRADRPRRAGRRRLRDARAACRRPVPTARCRWRSTPTTTMRSWPGRRSPAARLASPTPCAAARSAGSARARRRAPRGGRTRTRRGSRSSPPWRRRPAAS